MQFIPELKLRVSRKISLTDCQPRPVAQRASLHEELAGVLPRLLGQLAVFTLVLCHQLTRGGTSLGVQDSDLSLLDGSFSQPGGHWLAFFGGCSLDRFFDLG